jgi:ATP-binding cassette subfamily F protein 3
VSFGEKTVFRGLDWVIRRGSRVAIVGVNGAGKTTLLRLLAGALEPSEGEVRLGHQVQVGYYTQHQAESLDLKATVLQELERTAPEMALSQVRAVAGAFLFTGDAVHKKCAVLSGGEKARVALAKLLLSPSNFLLLDEPTNHLDVESRAVLLEALQGYEGTLCLVSHDREFIGPLVDSVLEITPSPTGSEVHSLLGGYEDYLSRKMKEIAESSSLSSGTETKATAPARTGARDSSRESGRPAISTNQRRSWERERDQLEARITQAEKRMAEISALLGDSRIYENVEQARALSEEHGAVSAQLGSALSRWEELCGWLEPGS